MPKLPTFSADPGSLPINSGRAAAASDFGTGDSSASISALGHRLADDMEQDDARDVIVKMQKLRADYSQKLRNSVMDGKDDLVKQQEDFDSDLSDIAVNVKTKRGVQTAQQHGAAASEEFRAAQAHVAAGRYGSQMKTDVEGFQSNASIELQTNPDGLAQTLATSALLMDTFTGRVPHAVIEAAIRDNDEKLTVSAVQSTIEMNPARALAQLQSKEYGEWAAITPEQRAGLVDRAQAAVAGLRTQANLDRAEEARQLKLRQDESMKDKFSDFTEHKLNVQQIIGDKTLTFEQQHTLYSMLEQQSKEHAEPVRTSPAAFSNILSRIRKGTLTNELEIENGYTTREISWDDVQHLRKEFEDVRTPEGRRLSNTKDDFIKSMVPRLDTSNFLKGLVDPVGKENVYKMQWYMDTKIQEYRDAKKDVYTLFDPASKDYLGNSVHLFKKTLAQETASMREAKPVVPVAPLAPAAPSKPVPSKSAPSSPAPKAVAPPVSDTTRRSGETMQQYLKRREGK